MTLLFNFLGPEGLLILVAIGIFIVGLVTTVNKIWRSINKKSVSKNIDSKIGQLEKLAKLKQKGILTNEEYEREKNKLL